MSKRFTYYNTSFTSTPVGGFILDDISSTPIYAWSFDRYLASAWVGNPVVRLRREADNVELDFTVEELTDGTAETWSAGGDAKSTIWYDQSGNGNDMYQLNQSYQYKMIIGGVMWRDSNGYPSSRGNVSGSIRGYTIPKFVLTGTDGAVFTAFKSSTPIGLGWRVMGGHGGNGNSYILGINDIDGVTPQTIGDVYANGNLQATNLASVNLIECLVNCIDIDWTSNVIWQDPGNDNPVMFNYMNVETQLNEAIVFNAFDDAERAQIETDQNTFYGYY